MQNKTVLLISAVVILIIGVLAVVFVLGNGKTNTNSSNAMSSTTPSTQGSVREITVVASEFAFTPSSIDVKKGENIRLIFKNNGSFPHNITIPALNLTTKTTGPGQTDTIEFVVQSDKSLEFFCSVDSHKDKGMTGQLNIK